METYSGFVDEIIYYNDDNGYAIAVLNIEYDVITIKGILPFINYGDHIRVVGVLDDHEHYGPQLQVKHIEHIKPTETHDILRYLASGVIKGIGEATAELIVEAFGNEALEVIQHQPDKLLAISGIGPKKLGQIVESYKEQYELKDFIIFFQSLNLTIANAMRIYKSLGYEAMAMVEKNPYILAERVSGIGFKVADRIAESMGVDRHSPYRIKAGIHFVLQQFSGEGHTYMPQDVLIRRVVATLKVVDSDVEIILKESAMQGEVFIEYHESTGMIRVFLPGFYYAEQFVAEKLYHLMHEAKPLKMDNIQSFIDIFEDLKGIKLGYMQCLALEGAIKNGVYVITGGPGTGKTTIINAVLEAYERHDKKISLLAPTGRAAKRMTEATRREAKTIHRGLEFQGELQFTRNEENPLDADVIIVDEISMVDIILMYRLLDAVKNGTHLILVGDADQLPSVGAGAVLEDILKSGFIPSIALDEIYRQADQSLITTNAHLINKGEMPLLNDRDKDFFFISRPKPNQILGEIEALVRTRLRDYYGFDPMEDIQVLSPMRNSPTGVNALNELLQGILNPESDQKAEKVLNGVTYRVGDKVMQTKNNYNIEWLGLNGEEGTGVFNGDIGYITDIDLEDKSITVLYDKEREVAYDYTSAEELTHAYAITVHKSQGSEFRAVIMPMGFVPPMLMSRNILYTAITRAKELVIIVGDKRAMQEMIKNDQEINRYSGLYERLVRLREIGV